MSIWKPACIGAVAVLALAGPATAETSKNVALILDASGSMNGKLRNGEKKLTAAKTAVRDLVSRIPGSINLSFRAYGHQSHRSRKNCRDTELLVPFGAATTVSANIVARSDTLSAQGYTPITYVLGLAADDLKPLSGPKTIILVSDGKETCEGDPCLLAKKLADANADLVIHTVGFGVDAQAKRQLQCIAKYGRGTYREADSTPDLAISMEEATKVVVKQEAITIKVNKVVPGRLKIINGDYHVIRDAETGEKAGTHSSSTRNGVKLKAGIYNVEFGKDLVWKSVAVAAGETTVIEAGVLKINNNQYHKIMDPETGKRYVSYAGSTKQLALPPGRYDVSFSQAIWRGVEIKEGQVRVLDPGILRIKNNQYHAVRDSETGKRLASYSGSTKYLALPPGRYNVGFDRALWRDVTLKGGEETVLKPGVLQIANNQYHHVRNVETGKRVAAYSSSSRSLSLPPGRYEVLFGKVAWPVTIREEKVVQLNPGGITISPRGYHRIFDAAGKHAITHSSSSKRV
ncbi:MAG: VWA domain-containing protein, partial [Rhizobiales bacterium]|nr:VWA domain-containing protein [Hyphomicrobiales bacterium]